MIYKSYLLEQKVELIDKHKSFMFYGENQGLKKEFKERIKLKLKNREILNLFQEDILKNKNILVDEILNKSLFEKEKVFFINQANDKILDIFEEAHEKLDNEKVFIFCDVLDSKSKLRKHFEKSKTCGITACYQDNEITIKKIIFEKLKNFQGLTPNVINVLVQNTNLDRNKLYNEIEKIISFFQNKKISIDKIDLLLNIKTNEDFNQLKDEALKGNKIGTNRLLADTVFELENNIYYLNSINQRIKKLNDIENIKSVNSNLESLISSLKPPIFWKDKPIMIEQSKKWNKHKIQLALRKTYAAEIELKSNSSLRKDLIIKNLIVELCSTANIS